VEGTCLPDVLAVGLDVFWICIMSNNKKPNLPAMPFYIGDWKKDPAVMAMTPEDEGIYLRLIMLCWESENRGYLQINNKPTPIELLARMIHLDNQRLTIWLTLYQDNFCIFGLTDDNIMYSKKQVDILELSEKRKNAGKKGGNPVLKGIKKIRLSTGKPISKPNAITETINIDEDVNEDESGIKNIVTEFYKYQKSQFSDLVKFDERQINDGIQIINYLVRLDGFSLESITEVLKFIVNDDFWSKQVLSLNGLRKKSKNGNTKFVNALLKSRTNNQLDVMQFNLKEAEKFLERGEQNEKE